MKSKFKASRLPNYAAIKSIYPDLKEDACVVRKGFVLSPMAISTDDEGCSIETVSTALVDRDREIMDPDGADLTYFKTNPVVMWVHDYSQLPVGQCLDIEIDAKTGMRTKTKYAPVDFAQDVFKMTQGGFLRGSSIGFIPVEMTWYDDNDFGSKLKDLAMRTGQNLEDLVGARAIHTKYDLIEYSRCPIPCNPEALTEAVSAKSISVGTKMLEEIAKSRKPKAPKTPKANPKPVDDDDDDDDDTESVKAVIGYHDYGNAPDDDSWDAGEEVKNADIPTLQKICAWKGTPADGEELTKDNFKLPHHHADGLKAVWKGVAAAMGVLLGARGGLDVPDEDRKGIYSHLSHHYVDFSKEAPDFKAIDPDDDTIEDPADIGPDSTEVGGAESDALKSVTLIEPIVEFAVQMPATIELIPEIKVEPRMSKKAIKAEALARAQGRV